ncbi:MAG: fused MFS/spermidine synthase [Gemmatimonadetes bacterium]|nr:fused MFS/spermidine synthase [Gemmatimonadota bacterium]
MLSLYTGAVFVSAFLLFLVQPMFGKMVLPLLGGSPSVWNTCMLFFQVALLGGYLYAHLTSRWLSPRRQWLLHLALLCIALLVLPISVSSAAPAGGEWPIPWLLWLMLTVVGAPFLVLAATGPMLQRWFARSGHPGASEPYHLYAASNLGSMLALLAYPLLLEPTLRLAEQTRWWMAGFILLGVLIAACGAAGWRSNEAERARSAETEEDVRPVTAVERALWVALAFVPSSLLLGVTTYITTDLTPAPLFWILPLALYLLSFTLVFASKQLIRHRWMTTAQPTILAATVIVLHRTEHMGKPAFAIPLHLAMLFVTAMVCHGELARRRPPVRHLTEFYLWISVGGALGGVFNVLLAPVLFSRLWEYPLMIVAACLLRPWPAVGRSIRRELLWAFRALAFAALLVLIGDPGTGELPVAVYSIVAAISVYLLGVALRGAPLWLAVCLGAAVGARFIEEARDPRLLHVERSFFGQYRINQTPPFNVLQHGSTLHGAQDLTADRRREPLTYYLRTGPLGAVFTSMGISSGGWRVAVVGLGVGTTAAYALAGDDWTFYEIDPGIERIARDRRYFTYLAEAAVPVRVTLGDARVSLQRYRGQPYDLIVLDAFSSDAIPIHLLTREALRVYLAHLAPGGRIAIHISNRYLDLEPVVASLAREAGLVARVGSGPSAEQEDELYQNSSTWVVVARRPADLARLESLGGWEQPELPAGFRTWSDDFSSLWSVMKW